MEKCEICKEYEASYVVTTFDVSVKYCEICYAFVNTMFAKFSKPIGKEIKR